MDSCFNLTTEERNYLFGLISTRLLRLQKDSFLFDGERIFLERLLSKLGFVLEYYSGFYVPKYSKKSVNSDKLSLW